jgi:hypothetical protein
MGEVGTEEPTVQVKMNGEVNGNHVEESPMEVDDPAAELKKTLKDNENEPKVLPSNNTNNKEDTTNGSKQKDPKEVMEIDDNESLNGDDPLSSQP